VTLGCCWERQVKRGTAYARLKVLYPHIEFQMNGRVCKPLTAYQSLWGIEPPHVAATRAFVAIKSVPGRVPITPTLSAPFAWSEQSTTTLLP